MHKITNSDGFTSAFPSYMPFLSSSLPPSLPSFLPSFFSYLIALVRTSSTMLNRSGKSRHLYLLSYLSGKVLSLLPLSMILWAFHGCPSED